MERDIIEPSETSKWLSDLGLAATIFDLAGKGYQNIWGKSGGK
jgi:hypothetical protein